MQVGDLNDTCRVFINDKSYDTKLKVGHYKYSKWLLTLKVEPKQIDGYDVKVRIVIWIV